MIRQRPILALSDPRDGAENPCCQVLERDFAAQRTGGTQGRLPPRLAETASRRRWLPGNALVKLDVGLGLAEEVPVRHRPEIIVPGGRLARGRVCGVSDGDDDRRNVRSGCHCRRGCCNSR